MQTACASAPIRTPTSRLCIAMKNELAYVKAADPLQKFRRMLLRYNRLTEEELKQIEAQAKKDLSTANRKAMAAPEPDPATIFDYVLPEPYLPQKYTDGTHKERKWRKENTGNRNQRNTESRIPP